MVFGPKQILSNMPLSRVRIRYWLKRLMGMPKGTVLCFRAYGWARSELVAVKQSLPDTGVETRAQPPNDIAPRGHRGVDWALRREKPTCLERALVLQAWLAASGPAPDVIIGVRAGESATEAHAWVDGADPWYDPSYEEITRLSF